jgi:hypothetical protein
MDWANSTDQDVRGLAGEPRGADQERSDDSMAVAIERTARIGSSGTDLVDQSSIE